MPFFYHLKSSVSQIWSGQFGQLLKRSIGSEAGYLAREQAAVPQETAEFIAHIFQSSLLDSFDFGPRCTQDGCPGLLSGRPFRTRRLCRVARAQKGGAERKGEERQVQIAPQQLNRSSLLFVSPIALNVSR
jgi:hypothetical protein